MDGVVSGADVVSRLFGSATTRHTAFRRWVQRNAKTFATRARVKLTYLPLTLLMKTFEINEGGLFINGVLYTLDGAARVGAGGLKLVARESFRYGTMSRALRRVDRATRKGDFGEASEALAEMEREGSSPEADRARRLVLRRAVRGLKGPADAPRTAEELAQLKAENLERARAVLAGLPARERGASATTGARAGADALRVNWVKSRLLGLEAVRDEIKQAVKEGAPWKIEAAYALLEGMTRELDPAYSLESDRKTAERRARDLQQSHYELAERVARKAWEMARHPRRYAQGAAQSASDLDAIRQQAAQAAALARSLLERVDGDPAYAFGPPRGEAAALRRLARSEFARLEHQLGAGPLTLARQAGTDAAIGTMRYVLLALWTWLRTGNLAHPGDPYLHAAQATALQGPDAVREQEKVALQRRHQRNASQAADERRRQGGASQ